MAEILSPLAFAVAAWWSATGLLLWLHGRPARARRGTLIGASLAAVVATAGLVASRNDDSVGAAYGAFACALVVWGWVEVTFLLGYVTGPRRAACPEGAAGWRRFLYACEVVVHHEFLIAGSALLVAAATAGGGNRVGLYAFLILWVMRLSAKLNLFLGVRNSGVEFLPERMRYLASYFPRRRLNPLFPLTVAAASAAVAWLAPALDGGGASATEVAGQGLLATLMGLAVLEHWFMVLPVPSAGLWSFCLRRPAGARGL